MIKEVTMYTVQCDNCKCTSGDNSDYAAWEGEESALIDAHEDGWVKVDDKHYCPDCYYYDSEDNLQVVKSRKDLHIQK